jgi:NAD(P)H dehydrogenase (quinone)
MPARIAIVYHSGFGHTEIIAEAVKRGAENAGGEVSYIKIPPDGKISEDDWNALNDAHAIVFGSPTYMGSASGPFKMFQDATSGTWMKLGWKDKLAGGFTNSHGFSGDKLQTLNQFVILAAQHGMIWVSLGLPGIFEQNEEKFHSGHPEAVNRIGAYIGVMAQSENAPTDKTPPSGDIKTAELYGARMVEAANRWFNLEG